MMKTIFWAQYEYLNRITLYNGKSRSRHIKNACGTSLLLNSYLEIGM